MDNARTLCIVAVSGLCRSLPTVINSNSFETLVCPVVSIYSGSGHRHYWQRRHRGWSLWRLVQAVFIITVCVIFPGNSIQNTGTMLVVQVKWPSGNERMNGSSFALRRSRQTRYDPPLKISLHLQCLIASSNLGNAVQIHPLLLCCDAVPAQVPGYPANCLISGGTDGVCVCAI